jgi:hypothetical protein
MASLALRIEDDPFGSEPLISQTGSSDALCHKIGNISRSLASLGVSLRTTVPLRRESSQTGMLQVLDSIESLVQELVQDGGRMNLIEAREHATIHQKPNLAAAIKIIVILCKGILILSRVSMRYFSVYLL